MSTFVCGTPHLSPKDSSTVPRPTVFTVGRKGRYPTRPRTEEERIENLFRGPDVLMWTVWWTTQYRTKKQFTTGLLFL